MLNSRVETFAARWKAARLAVLRAYVPRSTDQTDETTLILQVPASCHADALNEIRQESLRVAESCHAEWGGRPTVDEIADLLARCGIACFGGAWRSESHGFSKYHYRGECPRVATLFACDYWREAASGAVAGLNQETRFARHRSLGHGDDGCLDFLYSSKNVEREHGVVPALLRHALGPTLERLRAEGCAVRPLGFSERKLFIGLTGIGNSLSATKKRACLDELRKELASRFDDIALVESVEKTL